MNTSSGSMSFFDFVALRVNLTESQCDTLDAIKKENADNGDRSACISLLTNAVICTHEQAQELWTQWDKRQIEARGEAQLRFGSYGVVETLGTGGYGRVYLVEREGKRFALKVLLNETAENKQDEERFLQEVEAIRKCRDSQHVVGIVDHGISNGSFFYSMEYMSKGDLHALVRRTEGNVDELLALKYIHDAALGVQELHKHGIIHRDIKPGNLFLDGLGAVKIGDCGLVLPQYLQKQDRIGDNATGTLLYMAPEQMRGQASVQSDIYALAATLYFILTKAHPFADESTHAATIARKATESLPNPASIRGGLLPNTIRLIRKAGSHDPKQRHASILEFIQDVVGAMAGIGNNRGDAAVADARLFNEGIASLVSSERYYLDLTSPEKWIHQWGNDNPEMQDHYLHNVGVDGSPARFMHFMADRSLDDRMRLVSDARRAEYVHFSRSGYFSASLILARAAEFGEDTTVLETEMFAASSHGISAADAFLGIHYARRTCAPRDMHGSMFWLARAAKRDCVSAMLQLAEIYLSSDYSSKHENEARALLRRCIDLGSGHAAFMLGDLLVQRYDWGTDEYKRGSDHIRLSSDRGAVAGHLRYARLLRDERRYDEAQAKYEAAILQGDPRAATELKEMNAVPPIECQNASHSLPFTDMRVAVLYLKGNQEIKGVQVQNVSKKQGCYLESLKPGESQRIGYPEIKNGIDPGDTVHISADGYRDSLIVQF